MDTSQDTKESILASNGDVEPSNAEPSNTEPSNTEPSNTEPSNTEPSNTEPSNTEPSNAAVHNLEPEDTVVSQESSKPTSQGAGTRASRKRTKTGCLSKSLVIKVRF